MLSSRARKVERSKRIHSRRGPLEVKVCCPPAGAVPLRGRVYVAPVPGGVWTRHIEQLEKVDDKTLSCGQLNGSGSLPLAYELSRLHASS